MRRFFQQLLPCILLLLLAMSDFPSSSLGLRAPREEAGSYIRGHGLSPAISPSQEVSVSGAEADIISAKKYAVSRRMVPQGPNPLHN